LTKLQSFRVLEITTGKGIDSPQGLPSKQRLCILAAEECKGDSVGSDTLDGGALLPGERGAETLGARTDRELQVPRTTASEKVALANEGG